ncbi:MAG: hypothetical protein Q9202_006818 [Teloschistes flavicans]
MATNGSSSGDATSAQLGHLAVTVTSGGPPSSAGPSTNPIIHPEARVIWDKAAREQYLLKVLKANGQILPLGNRPFTELKMIINGFIHLQGKHIPVFVPRSEKYLELHFAVQEILEVQIDQAVELLNGLRNQLVQAKKLYYEKDGDKSMELAWLREILQQRRRMRSIGANLSKTLHDSWRKPRAPAGS